MTWSRLLYVAVLSQFSSRATGRGSATFSSMLAGDAVARRPLLEDRTERRGATFSHGDG